jgi:hypothetical protein
MSTNMSGEVPENPLAAGKLLGSANTNIASSDHDDRVLEERSHRNQPQGGREKETALPPLLAEEVANEFRTRWDTVQNGFVDDPRRAVRDGDLLIAQVMKSMAETFSNERTSLESQLSEQDHSSTENLRLALRSYRSFLERLLAV